QWPLFAVFFAVMWWRMLRLESQRLDEEAEFGPEFEEVGSGAVEPGAAESGAAGPGAPVGSPSVSEQSAPSRAEQPARIPEQPADDLDDDPELAAYNRMLAELAVRDRAAEAARGR
ncbi:MAG: hypothetical protein QOC67_3043, partial [Pseudonocardiales bacterium]|nr:hypothetical protein [Pseudonocardiales bacterium]